MGIQNFLLKIVLEWFSKIHGIKYASLRYFNAAGYDIKKSNS